MGGNNSGRHPDPEAKPTVEDYCRWAIDVRVIGRALSQPGSLFGYSRCRHGKSTGSRVVGAVHPDGLQLACKIRQDHGAWEWLQESVRLDTTDCTYGGKRYWLRCPVCDRRTVTVYFVVQPFRCRVCLGLGYHSQRQDATDRALHRWQTLLRRLGGSGSIANDSPKRPKGMQRRVYERLSEEAEEARINFWGALAERFDFSASPDREDDDEGWEEDDDP